MVATIWTVALSFGTALSLLLHYLNRNGAHPTIGKVADAVDEGEKLAQIAAPKA